MTIVLSYFEYLFDIGAASSEVIFIARLRMLFA